MTSPETPAILALADGSVFEGVAIGVAGQATGEVVFNTAMTGYQEILTDPSYAQQMVTLTYPHIGNVGVNAEDQESKQCHVAGLIIRDLSLATSNWRSQQSLAQTLQQHNIVAIADIDTRQLTHHLRDHGAQNGCITTDVADQAKAIAAAQAAVSLNGLDLAQTVTCDKSYVWDQPTISLTAHTHQAPEPKFHVVAYDFGVKQNILRLLVDRACKVTVVPATTPVEEVLALKPNAVFLSNGPGDPAPCDYAISAIQILLQKNMPLFGICLGFQLLSLACGAKTLKMKFGHHGANHPVRDNAKGTVMISSQNHSFAVDEKTLPNDIEVTHVSLFDGSLQGIRHKTKPAFGFQGHPEASPGPHDVQGLFDDFIAMMV